jgi:TatD DNase family protein
MEIRLIDSHAHLDGEKFASDREAVLQRARDAGVVAVLTIGVDLASSERAVALASENDALYATVGVHPHDAAKFDDADWPKLERLWGHPRVCGVGETGLDYFYDFSPRERQQALFRRHLEVAGEVGHPVVIHIRDAYDDAFALIAEVGLPAGGVVHCFTGGPAECARALELGLYVSIPGIVTFKNGESIREAIPLIPDDRLLVETDSPYLAPIPHRGRRNEPAYVVETARRVAEVRGRSLAEIADLTRQNTCRLFHLPAL